MAYITFKHDKLNHICADMTSQILFNLPNLLIIVSCFICTQTSKFWCILCFLTKFKYSYSIIIYKLTNSKSFAILHT